MGRSALKIKYFFGKYICCKIFSYTAVFIFFTTNILAQLTVNPGLTPVQLANLLAGQGVTISNVVYNGSPNAEGSFNGAATNLGLGSGILLASGNINDAVGPNDTTDAGRDLHQPGDNDLETLTGINTFDAAVLEFDFIPQSDSISFRYVFASEEYPEYVCSKYNDVFGFFISGPGIVGTPNIALIPGTASPVAINTVNNGIVGDSVTGPPSPNCGLGFTMYYFDNTGGTTIQYDGFTSVIEAKAYVTRCLTYHLKIAIADGTDEFYDSGVFLEAGSLYATPIVTAGNDAVYCKNVATVLGGVATSGWSYTWNPSTGLSNPAISNPSLTLSNTSAVPLIINYAVAASDGTCTLRDTVVITVNPIPTSTFISTTPAACTGSPINITYTGNAIPSATYTWNFGGAGIINGNGQGPYSISYPLAAILPISLTVTQYGCVSNSTNLNLPVNATPVSSFNSQPVICQGVPMEVTFNGIAGINASYTWSFGSGNPISGIGIGPYFIDFPTLGNTQLSLIVNDNGCKDTSFNSLIINETPLADVSAPASFCTTDTVSVIFTGTAGINATYSWNFGNAVTLSGTVAGPYQLQWNMETSDSLILIVSDNGCKDTATTYINSFLQPVASFTLRPTLCELEQATISFNGIATNASTMNWQFSNAIFSGSGQGPYYVQWNTPGIKPIQLLVSNHGCTNNFYDTIVVFSKPNADLIVLPVCEGLNSEFKSSGSSSGGSLNYYNWSFGDNTFAINDSLPLHLYSTYGIYPVQLIVKSTDGCADTLQQTYTVYENPIAKFTSDTACYGNTSHLFDQSTIQSTNINSWKWLLGSGDSILFQSCSYTYSAPGIYSVSLMVTTNQGCSDTIQNPLRVWNLPLPDFTADINNGCQPLLVKFTNASTSIDGVVNKWHWQFGDGTIDSISFPQHVYLDPGTFNVDLHIVSSTGCENDTSLSDYITVYPNPVAYFSYSPEQPDMFQPQITFLNLSENNFLNQWTFGDGSISLNENPVHNYKSASDYPVQLIVTSNNGCKDTISENIIIKNIFSLYIPNAFTPNHDTWNDTFQVFGEGIAEFNIQLFDRWGKLFFKSNSITDAWDGTYNNSDAPEDTYVYHIMVSDIFSKPHEFKGKVSLFR